MKRISTLLEKDENAEKDSKQYEADILKLLTSNDRKILEDDDLKFIQYGVIISAKDLKTIIINQNEFKQ
jgi:hypothetical protein